MPSLYVLGIDIGSSSVKLAALSADGELLFTSHRSHKGSPTECLRALLEAMSEQLPFDGCAGWVVTGSGASLLSGYDVCVCMLEEVPAVTRGAELLAPDARSIIEIGAQSALFVTSIEAGKAPQFSMNESCAAGTGSFFEDQMGRLGLAIEDYSSMVENARFVPRLSGRCAVFAKTDIIHHQQEGVSVEDILLGLCFAMVRSFKTVIVGSLPVERPVALSGGVLANRGLVRAVREVFGLEENELLASPVNVYFQAVGAAREALKHVDSAAEGDSSASFSLKVLYGKLSGKPSEEPLPRLFPLTDPHLEPGRGYHTKPRPWPAADDGKTPCVLGVDVGSTSTNLVLVDREGDLLDAQYLRTRGNPKQAVMEGLHSLGDRLGNEVCVTAVGVTGSGRKMIGKMIGADVVRDEITAQARAAVQADPAVDTVFEIGGQDSKYVSLKDGRVADFEMNKICAAGTGSFVEEQAVRLGIPLDEYGLLALSARSPLDLGERCTVFVETAINTALAKGADKNDVAAGLCLSVVRNYLHRVVGTKPVGNRIVLQGGVAFNSGIVGAFAAYYGDVFTVSPWFAVSGAVGAALLAMEADVADTSFRGFDLGRPSPASSSVDHAEVEANRRFFRKTAELFSEGYDPSIDPSKKTVGIPRCLVLYKLFPMANTFFKQLGYNVLLSDETNEEITRLAQQCAQGETCYPVKLVHGHMMQLMERGVDYIFMPSMHTIRHEASRVAHNYACTYMQAAPRMIARELGFERRGITLLSPLIEMDFGQKALVDALLGIGELLGKSPQESARAMMAGGFAVQEFTRKTEELGEQLLEGLASGERVLVMITRNYGIADPALNMGIPDALLDRGQKVITLSHLPAHDLDVSRDHPGLYWPFGQHVLSGAKLVRRDPRLYAVYLTNHGCGPDGMLSHLFREEMADKPYLHIETDEHSSPVGVVTRIEAFLNTLDHYEATDESSLPLSLRNYDAASALPEASHEVALPSFGAYGPPVGAWLERKGFRTKLLVPDSDAVVTGRKHTTSKEYLSFTALLGMSLLAAEEATEYGRQVQLLLPSTDGAEADGQYDRVIRGILDEEGYGEVTQMIRTLDRLPWTVPDADGLFLHLLAGDVIYAALTAYRAGVAADLLEAEISYEQVCVQARRVNALCRLTKSGGVSDARGKTLQLVGEWPCVYSDELTGGMWSRLEEDGYRLMRMPFSEYLWFLWNDAYEADNRKVAAFGPVGAVSPDGPFHDSDGRGRRVFLDRCANRMRGIHRLLGEASPFCEDMDELGDVAQNVLGRYRGANGRYRAAKERLVARAADGVITAASMYENTDTVLKLSENLFPCAVPMVRLSFDGSLDQGMYDKLNSFLYYL